MNPTSSRDEQVALWSGSAGRAWVDTQPVLDQMFQPFEAMLVDAVAAAAPRRVLDVGCGTGTTTLAIARRVASRGSCTGIDISAPMITAGRARAAEVDSTVSFIHGDAQDHAFDPAAFDMIVSRFGVMFFGDAVLAFSNVRRAVTDESTLRVIVWRSAAENPFMTTAERAAASLLPLPPRRPDAPGQFGWADSERVRTILGDSGWRDVDIQPVDVVCTFPEDALVTYVTRLGPVGTALAAADADTRASVTHAVRAAFDPFVDGPVVRFTAACWTIGARAATGPTA